MTTRFPLIKAGIKSTDTDESVLHKVTLAMEVNGLSDDVIDAFIEEADARGVRTMAPDWITIINDQFARR